MAEPNPAELPATASLRLRTRGVSQRHVLSQGELVTIGRSSSCQIRVRDASVSREHCIAVYAGGRLCLNDLRSTHGITLDGSRVDRCELEPGDSCHLGNALLLFEPRATVSAAAVGGQTAGSRADGAIAGDGAAASMAADGDGAPADEGAADAGAADGADVDGATADRAAADGVAADEDTDDQPDAADAAPAAADDAPATVAAPPPAIPGYALKQKLGEGGFGVVYRAEHLQLGREVALKLLKPGSGDATARVEAFLREARAAARLSHPHLVQVFDVGEADGTHFLSMELVEGESLARRLRRDGPMDWPQVITLLQDVAEALDAAHRAGIVHRDVKPANILLGVDGRTKLTDLGLAGGSEHAGTVAFMAPEQLRREPTDARSDIYALGCTAYAALAGSPPFLGSRQQIARAQLRDRPTPFEQRNVMVPWHLQQLVLESMLAKDAADRPPDAAALLARLDRLILPGEALPPAAPGSAQPQRARRRAGPGKTLLARLAADSIIFTVIAAVVIVVLLLLKYRWPGFDIYRLIGR